MSTAPRRRELTPAQHQRIRQQIALIPLYIWVVYAWWAFIVHLPVPPINATTHITRDFLHFYTQGVIAREHNLHALYDIDAMAAVATRVVPAHVEVKFPPVYGPQVPLLFLPLAFLSYVPAMMIWLALTIIGYGLCMGAVWRSTARPRGFAWPALVLALGAPGFLFTLSFGQVSLLALLCFTAIWLLLKGERLFLAGLAVGALAYKPQLGIVAACVFVGAAEWRVVAGAAVAIAVQAVAAWAYWGRAAFAGYIRALMKLPGVVAGMEPDKSMMHSWRAFFLHLGVPEGAAVAITVVLSLATIAAAVYCWRARGDLAPRYVVLTMATLLVDPHIYAYDLLLLVPALLVAWDWAPTQAGLTLDRLVPPWAGSWVRSLSVQATIRALVLAVYTAPIVTIGIAIIPVQWSVLSFLALGAMLARLVLASSAGSDTPTAGWSAADNSSIAR